MGWGKRWLLAVLLTGHVACKVSIQVDRDAVIECETDSECSPPLSLCHPDRKVCVASIDDTPLPEPTVAFVDPADGATGVATDTIITVAFSLPVEEQSVIDRVSLVRSDTSAPVVTTVSAVLDNLVRITPAALEAGRGYQLTIAAGVVPLETGAATPSTEAFLSSFTVIGPDLIAPNPVTDLLVTRSVSDQVTLSWTNPGDGDAIGALVLRQVAGPVTETPVDGTPYTAGTMLGTAEVVITTPNSIVIDSVDPSGYGYAVYAYDAAHNYSVVAAVPFVSDLAVSWCTDETGEFEVTGQGMQAQQIWVSDQANAQLSEGEYFPPSPGVPGGPVATAADAPYTTAVTNYVRPVALGATGTFIGPAEAILISSSTLPILEPPLPVEPDAPSIIEFEPFAWTQFEVEADTDSGLGVSFSPTGVSQPPPLGTATRTYGSAGTYVFRMRPVMAGCNPAPWTESTSFTVGNLLYVAPGGTGDGSSPSTPLGSIGDAILAGSMSGSAVDVLIAAGTYTESITLEDGVSLFGSYDATFVSRAPWPPTTTVTSSGTAPTVTGDSAIGPDTQMDGVIIDNAGDTTIPVAVSLEHNAGNPTLSNLLIRTTGMPTTECRSLVVQSSALIRDSLVETCVAGPGIGIYDDSGTPTVLRTTVSAVGAGAQIAYRKCDGPTCNQMSASTFEIRQSILIAESSNSSAWGVRATRTEDADSTAIIVSSLVDVTVAASGVARAIDFENFSGSIVNNTLRASAVNSGSTVVTLDDSSPTIVNNIVFTGDGSGDRRCLRGSSGSLPGFRHNLLFECPDSLYHELGNFVMPVEQTEVCSGGILREFCPDGTVNPPGNFGNITLGSLGAVGFMDANDLHLTAATPTSVRILGEDTSSTSVCACGDVDLDLDGATRSCPEAGVNCVSLGAYEY